jgi:hypothetical protein
MREPIYGGWRIEAQERVGPTHLMHVPGQKELYQVTFLLKVEQLRVEELGSQPLLAKVEYHLEPMERYS